MKTYEIKYEPVIIDGRFTKEKYNVYYYDNDTLVLKEFHSLTGALTDGLIREEYKNPKK